jgi:hypothetical protein
MLKIDGMKVYVILYTLGHLSRSPDRDPVQVHGSVRAVCRLGDHAWRHDRRDNDERFTGLYRHPCVEGCKRTGVSVVASSLVLYSFIMSGI